MDPRNPWLDVSLGDYEGHMTLPHVAQAQLLSDVFAQLLDRFAPRSVAVVGCAGGNGFERIDPAAVGRVVGIDINRDFLDAAKTRFGDCFRSFELICADVEQDAIAIEPVDLVYAALLLEYTDPAIGFRSLRGLASLGGLIATVSQLPSESIPEITPSPYACLTALAPRFRFVDGVELRAIASSCGFEELESTVRRSAGGKEFRLQLFALRGR